MYASRTCKPVAKLKITRDSITNMADPLRGALDASLISVLEAFVHHGAPEQAFAAYSDACGLQPSDLQGFAAKLNYKAEEGAALILTGNRFAVAPEAYADVAYGLANAADIRHWEPPAEEMERLYNETRIADFTELSGRTLGLTAALGKHFELRADYEERFDREEFGAAVDRLERLGLLTSPRGEIDFGEFRRLSPFCPYYGFSRGTPIDRYYLSRFVAQVRDQVVGDILEIGGRQESQEEYGLEHGKSFAVMELSAQPGVDFAGDAHDSSACEAESRDSILLFNVLEHCERPSQVLQNVLRWLRPGGKVFCLTPNAQRVHRDPKDYWRIYPDAFEAMLRDYSNVQVTTYGNLLSCHASLSGVSAEELSPEELDFHDSRYPVITCAVAEKPRADAARQAREATDR